MIHINRAGSNLGIFSEADVTEGLRSGRFAGADLGWREGMANWQPLSQFPEFASDMPTSAASPSGTAPAFSTAPPAAPVKNEPLAIWSLVLSGLSLVCCGPVLAIPGVICGHMALAKFKSAPYLQGKNLATIGLIIGYVSIAIWFIYVVFFGGLAFLKQVTESTNR